MIMIINSGAALIRLLNTSALPIRLVGTILKRVFVHDMCWTPPRCVTSSKNSN